MNVFKPFLLSTAAVAALAGCAQDEPVMMPVVAPAETPIYGKDGTVIGMRPTVSPGGTSMDDMDDMDDDDDDDDG